MTIKTLLLDDDIPSQKAACAALAAFPQIEIAGRFRTGEELFAWLEKEGAQLLFLDIELQEELGFQVAERLRRSHPELLIVFLTGHASYAIDGYDFQPVNFLTKPINHLKLENTVREVERRLGSQPRRRSAQVMFRLAQGYRIVDVDDVCLIERQARKNYLVLPDERVRIAYDTMRELEEMLEPHDFFLCHQSFLISLRRVKQVRDAGRQLYEAVLEGCGQPAPVSRNRYVELMSRLRERNLLKL